MTHKLGFVAIASHAIYFAFHVDKQGVCMMTYKFGFVAILCSTFLWMGCGDSSTNFSDSGTLKVSLTDAPARFEAVNVTFSEITANINGEWVTVHDGTQTINLLQWNNGQAVVVGEANVPAGTYNQIRLKINQAEVIENGQTYNLNVPSGAQSGLKLNVDFDVVSGSTYEIIIDFDADRSVVKTGSAQSSNKFILKPTLRAVSLAITGSISGSVSSTVNAPIAYAIVGSDTVTSTIVNSTSGEFKLAFLPAGNYNVVVQDTTGVNTSANGSFAVVAGSDNNMGMITLQVGVLSN